MPTLRSLPDPLQDLDGRLRKDLVKARLFRADSGRSAGGRYRFSRRLGVGGTGVVYAARDEQLDRMVALKLLRAVAPTGTDRDRLRREAQILGRLNHPNIVTVFGLTEYEGHCVVVMELVEGPSLRGQLSGSAPSPNTYELVITAGRGLAAAHAAGIVHGDFKPENVLVAAADGVVKVVDFGLARIETGAVTRPTQPDADDLATVEGLTPAYAAPERLAGAAADARSDQYSLCVTLWEASTGSRPRAERGTVAPARGVRRVLERGLQREPDARWPSVEALLDALEATSHARRPWAVAAVASVVMLAAVPSLLPDEVDACAGRPLALDAVWAPGRRARIVANLASVAQTQPRVIAQTQPLVIADSLDAHARRWSDAHRDACIAMTRTDAADQAEIDERFACLRAQLEPLDTLAVALETAGVVEVASAAGSILSLPDPEDCLHRSDSPLAPEIDSLLARAEVLEDVGRGEQALELLESATLPDERAALLVDVRRAGVLTTLDRRAQARAVLEHVYLRAVELGHERSAAMAALALVFDSRPDAGPKDEAATWLRHASTMLERMPADADLELSLEHARATMLRYSGARVAAMELFERLEPRVERRFGRGSKQWVTFRYHRAGTCREAGRFDRELELARDGLVAARSVLGDHHRLTLDIKSLLGGALVELARTDEAKTVLTETREAFERIYGRRHEALQYVHADLADLADLEGDLEQARDHYDAALAILEERGGREGHAAVALLTKRASVIWRLGDTERATAEFHRAFELTVAHSGPSSPRAIEILNNLLAHQGRDEQWAAAAMTLERGRAWLEYVDDPLSRAQFMHNDGVIEAFRGDLDEGIRVIEQAIALAGTESSEFAIDARMHLADILWDRRGSGRDRRRARELVAEAAAIARKAGHDDTPPRHWLDRHAGPQEP